MSILSAILITAPLTFVAGWLACKTLLNLGGKTPAAQETPATPRDFDPNATIQRPDGRELLAQALEQSAATATQPDSEVTDSELQRELSALKEALAERDHTISELKAQVRDLPDLDQLPELKRSSEDTAELTAELESLKHENLLMNGRLHRAEADADKHLRHMVNWRERAKPLVKQCRQQRRIINELREQLRSGVKEEQEAQPGITVEIPADDLQVLRGIGPALEKRLNSQGIYCYRQIAAMTEADLVELGQSLGIARNRTLSSEWLAQAKELVQADDQAAAEIAEYSEAEPA